MATQATRARTGIVVSTPITAGGAKLNHAEDVGRYADSPGLLTAPEERLVDHSAARLGGLCRAVGFEDHAVDRAVSTLRRLMHPWGAVAVGGDSGWVSDIADDHSPIEFSLSFDGGIPEVRMMIEAQGMSSTLESQAAAAIALTQKLAHEPGVDLERFHLVADLFLPEEFRAGKFGLWHSFCFGAHGEPTFKVYFNPLAHGEGREQGLVQEALNRLGFRDAWPLLAGVGAARGPIQDELKYFALDLTRGCASRVKVYFLHHEAMPGDLDAACRTASSLRAPRSADADRDDGRRSVRAGIPAAIHLPCPARDARRHEARVQRLHSRLRVRSQRSGRPRPHDRALSDAGPRQQPVRARCG